MRRSIAMSLLLAASAAHAALIPSPDGQTVYDTTLHVRWLANANLAATQRFGLGRITPGGSMDYLTALQFVAALNAANYLGHNNWQLPATPLVDSTCAAVGPNGGSFGKGCLNSAMGSLFYRSLGLQFPNTAVPIPTGTTGPFVNFQPYLYWSGTATADTSKGFHTFSFNTGWEGANVDGHFMYVIPMIKGRLPGTPVVAGTALQPGADGKTVYDPVTDITWLADADLAKTQTFGAQCVNHDGTACINPDGSMSHATAVSWINGMNAAAWLGHTNWQLPPVPDVDPTCGAPGGFDCTVPFGDLYYNQFRLPQGTPVVATPAIRVGPFFNVQPYLYWSCQAAAGSAVLCGSDFPAPNFSWSFSWGNGFQGTDLLQNDMYVMVYAPEPPAPPRRRAARH